MFLLRWLQQYHEIKNAQAAFKRENTICESCETLKHELEVVRLENQRLIDRILEKPAAPPVVDTSNLKPIAAQHIPWRVRQQMLEAEDRKKAQLLREKEKENTNSAPSGGQVFKTPASTEQPMTTEQLEVELDVAEGA